MFSVAGSWTHPAEEWSPSVGGLLRKSWPKLMRHTVQYQMARSMWHGPLKHCVHTWCTAVVFTFRSLGFNWTSFRLQLLWRDVDPFKKKKPKLLHFYFSTNHLHVMLADWKYSIVLHCDPFRLKVCFQIWLLLYFPVRSQTMTHWQSQIKMGLSYTDWYQDYECALYDWHGWPLTFKIKTLRLSLVS